MGKRYGARRTRGQILALLCGGERTAAELASDLEISGSAVRVHLGDLAQEGLVAYEQVVKSVGKPSHRYRLTAAGEGLLSRAYLPLMEGLFEVLAARLKPVQMEALARDVGRRLAERHPPAQGDGPARLRAGIELLESLGGIPEVEASPAGATLRGKCCPVAALAHDYPQVCSAIEELLTVHTGLPARQHCNRTGRPSCSFELTFARLSSG